MQYFCVTLYWIDRLQVNAWLCVVSGCVLYLVLNISTFKKHLRKYVERQSMNTVLMVPLAVVGTQIDFRVEASNLRRFLHNFRDMRDVTFPTPVDPLVTDDVLVETYEEGVAMLHLMKGRMYEEEIDGGTVGIREEEEEEQLRLRVARLGCHTLLKMVINDNFIHADLHPGKCTIQTYTTYKAAAVRTQFFLLFFPVIVNPWLCDNLQAICW